MGKTFRPYQPGQILMLPPDLREWVPEGHLAHHVSDLVDAVDLSAFYAPYEGDGRRNSPYDPQMMPSLRSFTIQAAWSRVPRQHPQQLVLGERSA